VEKWEASNTPTIRRLNPSCRHQLSRIALAPFLLVHLPIMMLAASIGWAGDGAWNLQEAALYGSSYYALPSPLRWFTANIGIHHIHHLCSRIPCYRLPLVLRDHPELAGIGRLTLLQSLGCVRLVLWDEGRQRLISFREMHQRYASV
jgi:acyl-lipid omega-6 desaturase (Delta-12 desaturase)